MTDVGSDTLRWKRSDYLESFNKKPHAKILIIGGGVHGASIARLAALNGVDCTLLERGDYASGTSSRSSKMAHGGLRYLENFDFSQVFEGIKAREEMFDEARHLCKPQQFLIPIKSGDWWLRLKLGVGLYLYDMMVTKAERRHGWIPRRELSFDGFHSNRTDLMGCYSYCDGILNDARVVIESIVDARARGARCLNYMDVQSVKREASGQFAVGAVDTLSGKSYSLTADLVINCAGPWAPFIGHTESQALKDRLRYSAGIHLLFNRPWDQPSLFLPMPGKSRYYFVWPHPGGTMAGTTEREVTDIPFEQYPIEAEVNGLLDLLKKDLPDAGLDRSSVHYAFAGVRTLPLRGDAKGTATLSRKHIWEDVGGVLTLLGGKLTTSSWTAFEGFKEALSLLEINQPAKGLHGVRYPGWLTDADAETITKRLEEQSVLPQTAKRIVRRLGKRAEYLLGEPSRTKQITPHLLKGEVELAVNEEQAETLEDILRRRTEVEYLPGSGLEELTGVISELTQSGRAGQELASEASAYRSRIKQILSTIGK